MAINVLTKQFWNAYLTTAQYDAGQFLGAKADPQVLGDAQEKHWILPEMRPTLFNYTNRGWDWSTHNTTIVYPSTPAKKTDKEKTEERAQWAKILGSIIAVAGAFIAGYTYRGWSRQHETAKYTTDVQGHMHVLPETTLKSTLQNLLFHQRKIDEINSSKVNNYFLAAIGVLAGGTALAVGGFVTSSWLMTAGAITLLAAAILAAANCGMHWNDHDDLKKHYLVIAGQPNRQIQGLADAAFVDLNHFTDNMNQKLYRHSEPVVEPQYQPLYPDFYFFVPPQPVYGDN